MYGTALGGGALDFGTAFMLTLDGATFVTLHAFVSETDGAAPFDALLEAGDGNFYGTAPSGGSSGAGTVFQVTPGGDFTVVYAFTDGADGGVPSGALVQGIDGSVYGTTYSGATPLLGTVFRLTGQ